jgi:hypothetical protein
VSVRTPLGLALAIALIGCGRDAKVRPDTPTTLPRRDSIAVDTTPEPRVVPYDPSSPGAMRSGDAPIRAASPAPVQPPTANGAPAATTPAPPRRAPAATPGTSNPAPSAKAPADADSVGDPVAIVREYYAAIRAHDFLRAYRMWEASGQRNVRSYAQFEAGFDSTESVDVKTGAPGRVEGAAGSRFVTVPVEIDSRLRNGVPQRFTGTYTLRRVAVPDASDAQRRWHLYAANVRQVE